MQGGLIEVTDMTKRFDRGKIVCVDLPQPRALVPMDRPRGQIGHGRQPFGDGLLVQEENTPRRAGLMGQGLDRKLPSGRIEIPPKFDETV